MASDLVELAHDRAWIGEELLTKEEYRRRLMPSADATNRALEAESKQRQNPGG